MQVGTLENLYTKDEEDYAVVYQDGENGTEERTRKITDRLFKENMEHSSPVETSEMGHVFNDQTADAKKDEMPPKTKEIIGVDLPSLEQNKHLIAQPLVMNSMEETQKEPLQMMEQQEIDTRSSCFSWFECSICKKIQNFFKRKKKTALKHLD
ncbi:MAG: hypothetical protein FJZ60_02925 [Chlamydiae bacterium]|nr:hypothetical protein [Chlamydiota bacterium]